MITSKRLFINLTKSDFQIENIGKLNLVSNENRKQFNRQLNHLKTIK